MITLPPLDTLPGIAHAFFTREGGVSIGQYHSLNCGFGSDDDSGHVAANRARAMAHLGFSADALVTVHQIHSPSVTVVDRPWAYADNPQADALVTRIPGVVLGILTADCVPVLFADLNARVVGAAHAGWKGATGGVLEATIARMEELGAQRRDIYAAIGPAIQQNSYEVGPEFIDRIIAIDPTYARFAKPAPRLGHFLFDLPGFVEHRLDAAGVSRIARSKQDTLSEESVFFSYRRTTLRKEPDYGRQLSAIALTGDRR